DVVVRALQERGVDRHHGTNALRREPARERDGVALGNADIEETLRESLLEDRGPRAAWHRGSDRHEVVAFLAERGERVAERLGPGRRTGGLLPRLAGGGVVGRKAVPLLAVRL